MKASVIVLAWTTVATLHAQGYGQAGGSGAGYGGYGGGSGAAIARVAVAPSSFGGGFGGFGGGQAGFGGGAQGFGNAGGGGLHGVTRWTPMAEPNLIAAQFFSAGGVNIGPALAPGATLGGSGFFAAETPTGRRNPRLATAVPAPRQPRPAIRPPSAARRPYLALEGMQDGLTRRAPQAAEPVQSTPPAQPALTAAQMAGVMPAETLATAAHPSP